MKIQLSQLDLIQAISKEVDKQAKRQKKKAMLVTHQFNAVIEAANIVVAAYGEEPRMATPSMGLANWLMSHDTGTSSKTMAAHLCGVHLDKFHWSHPLDNSDLGRCIRFLEAVPEAKADLSKMAEVSPVWASLVNAWDELAALYTKEPSSRELYDRMKQLGC